MNKKIFALSVVTIGAAVSLFTFQNCSSEHAQFAIKSLGNGIDYSSAATQLARTTLQAKCSECHSPSDTNTTPIENILDFQSLLDNDYIIVGAPEESPLYITVLDEMGKLTPHEAVEVSPTDKEAIRNWLLQGESDIIATAGDLIPDPGTTVTAPTFTNVNNFVILPSCGSTLAACHSTARSLTTYANVMRYVTAGAPNASAFYTVTISTQNTMPPPPRAKLTATQSKLISDWIASGAPNN